MSQHDHIYEDLVERGMARTMFGCIWADYVEEFTGRSLQGEILDQAPETPEYVIRDAYRLAGMFEQLNGPGGMIAIAHRAAMADMHQTGGDVDLTPEFLRELGSDLAMQAMGHGVSWFDDHEEFEIKFPYMEYSYFDLHDDEYPIPETTNE